MATSVESAFAAAVSTANQVRQNSYAAALATYQPNGFGAPASGTSLATYQTAIQAADAAWLVAVNAAANTAAIISPRVVDELQGQPYNRVASIIS